MADIETLTDEERASLTAGWYTREQVVKALRIIDALTEALTDKAHVLESYARMKARAEDAEVAEARVRELTDRAGILSDANEALEESLAQLRQSIARARLILAEGRPVDSAESRLAHDLREALGVE